jgi:20S proteasome alpha/beta subunit
MEAVEKTKEYLKGTTTVGLTCKEGVVLVTDRRATMGSLIAHKEVDKIFKLDDHIGMTVAQCSFSLSLADLINQAHGYIQLI